MLPVAVEVYPADPPREQLATLLSACSRAVGEAECVLVARDPEGDTQAVAIVTWQSDGRAAVEVGLRRAGRPEWRSRTVSFSENDEPLERWRAVGFVVGTMARDESGASAAASRDEAPPPRLLEPAAPSPPLVERPVPVVPVSPKSRPGRSPRGVLELGAVIGPGLDGLRTGAVLRSRFPIYKAIWPLFAAKYMERARDDVGLKGQWLTLGAGLALAFDNEPWELSTSLDVRAEYFRASAEDAFERTGVASRWLPGLSLGIAGARAIAPPLGLYLGAEGALMFSRTTIRVNSAPYTEDFALRVSVDGGVQLKLW